MPAGGNYWRPDIEADNKYDPLHPPREKLKEDNVELAFAAIPDEQYWERQTNDTTIQCPEPSRGKCNIPSL